MICAHTRIHRMPCAPSPKGSIVLPHRQVHPAAPPPPTGTRQVRSRIGASTTRGLGRPLRGLQCESAVCAGPRASRQRPRRPEEAATRGRMESAMHQRVHVRPTVAAWEMGESRGHYGVRRITDDAAVYRARVDGASDIIVLVRGWRCMAPEIVDLWRAVRIRADSGLVV